MKKEKIKISVFICKKHRVQAVLNRNKMSTCSDSRYCCPKCYDFDNLQEITTFARILTKEPKVKMLFAALRKRGVELLVRCGSGCDHIDLEAAAKHGIFVENTPGQNAPAVAELVIANTISLARRICYADNRLKAGKEVTKSDCKGIELSGKTLGIIGLGYIGSLVAKKAHALGMKVIGYDSKSEQTPEHIERVKLSDIWARSKFITVHVPLIEDGENPTRNLINLDATVAMKQKPFLINCARAGVVDLGAVSAAILTGSIEGYASDVDDHKHDVFKHYDAIITPHIGASTDESEERCAEMAAQQAISWLQKGNIVNGVNLPDLSLDDRKNGQVTIVHLDEPGMLENITGCFRKHELNIGPLGTRDRNGFAYTMIGPDKEFGEEVVAELRAIKGVIRVITL